MRSVFSLLVAVALAGLMLLASDARASTAPIEVHQRLAAGVPGAPRVALTLDACGGGFDRTLVEFLVARRIPATVFVTARWIERNPDAVVLLRAHADLFQIEGHGARHVPAVIGSGRRVYGLAGEPDLEHLRDEVEGGAAAMQAAFGTAPRWYRGATALYDAAALRAIGTWGYRVAGFSLNADAGARLPADAVARRVAAAVDGDVILAHLNHPESGTGAGLQMALPQLQARGYRFVRLDQATLAAAP